jgi:hypothetical protein
MAAATTVPAVLTNLAAQLRLRAGLAGVAVHTVDLGGWTDTEAIVFGQVTAPQAWLGLRTLGSLATRENATLAGYVFTQLAGDADSHADTAHARAGVLLNELVAQVQTDPNVSGAIPAAVARIPPLLTTATWSTWIADQDGTAIQRVRVDWQLTYEAKAS